MATAGEQQTQGGLIGRPVGFLRESIEELKKVSFPSRQDTIQGTVAAVFIIIFVACCLGFLDWVFVNLMFYLQPGT